MSTMIQIIAAAINTLGFGIVFKVRKELLPWTTLGGVLAWVAYLVFDSVLSGVFLPYFFATIVAAVYAEIMARVLKAPGIIFLILSIVPSIPGKSLFFTMQYVVTNRSTLVSYYGSKTLTYAFAIACGISFVWALNILLRNLLAASAKKREAQRSK